MRKLKTVFCAAVAAPLLIAATASGQTYPGKPVKMLVPFPPGGVTDGVARITADWLTQHLGQTFVVENRPGASGAIAADAVARAPADGYTLLVAASPVLTIVPHVQKVAFDPFKTFAPVSVVASSPFALGVGAEVPVQSLKEFVDYVRARPGKLSYASAGQATVSNLTMALFLARADLQMEAVSYKGGGPAVADLVAGHVPTYFGNLSELLPHSGSARVRILATSGERRAEQLPNVPTVAEQGYPGFRTVTWNGIAAPAGTPPAIVERLGKTLQAACGDRGFAERLVKLGVDPLCTSPAGMAGLVQSDFELWKKAVQAAGIKVQ